MEIINPWSIRKIACMEVVFTSLWRQKPNTLIKNGFPSLNVLDMMKWTIRKTQNTFWCSCPVKSRIKTDIDEALEIIPVSQEGKPVILVVMHHTFNPHTIIMESRLQVTRPDVRLTVDCLFYEGRLLPCNINNIARNQIQSCLGFAASKPTWLSRCANWLWKNKVVIVSGVICFLLRISLIIEVPTNLVVTCSQTSSLWSFTG
ncbi:unnamed protein product [Tetraodon nigroviridis]|uniref:(spotted green pufferfish) hypothetical protein n=1 Tax=Tetraodon nigroviridis TaxID=99883 RepID=Q4T534_TETNG|nr:unnamed protein product [Tetraodon nigroviridis]